MRKKPGLPVSAMAITWSEFVDADPGVLPFFQAMTHGEWGVGIDAVGALEVWPFDFPGFKGLHLEPGPAPHMGYTAAG